MSISCRKKDTRTRVCRGTWCTATLRNFKDVQDRVSLVRMHVKESIGLLTNRRRNVRQLQFRKLELAQTVSLLSVSTVRGLKDFVVRDAPVTNSSLESFVLSEVPQCSLHRVCFSNSGGKLSCTDS